MLPACLNKELKNGSINSLIFLIGGRRIWRK
jgi:hypothetical protein